MNSPTPMFSSRTSSPFCSRSDSNLLVLYSIYPITIQVNKMIHLEEMHIRNLKVRSLAMATLLLDNLPSLKKASNW